MITLVDYGLGNIKAFANIYKRLGIAFRVAKDAEGLRTASRLILPGVGAFDWAIKRLEASGMRQMLDDLVLNQEIPVLGVCVGMQMMANRSEEGELVGLGWIQGEVKRLDIRLLSTKTRLPHMGWNDVQAKPHDLFKKITDPHFYFLHSYYFSPMIPEQVLGTTDYGQQFAAAVCNRHIIGVQFHPEKSHHSGIQLLQNFAEL